MNNNEIQRYTSILLGKENVETLSDLQLLFNRYNVNISRRFDAVKMANPCSIAGKTLHNGQKKHLNVVKNIFIVSRLMRKIPIDH